MLCLALVSPSVWSICSVALRSEWLDLVQLWLTPLTLRCLLKFWSLRFSDQQWVSSDWSLASTWRPRSKWATSCKMSVHSEYSFILFSYDLTRIPNQNLSIQSYCNRILLFVVIFVFISTRERRHIDTKLVIMSPKKLTKKFKVSNYTKKLYIPLYKCFYCLAG